jgi:hypothetical protein
VANFAREVGGERGPAERFWPLCARTIDRCGCVPKRGLPLASVFQPKGDQEFDVRLAQLLMGRQDPLFDVLLYLFVRWTCLDLAEFGSIVVIEIAKSMQCFPDNRVQFRRVIAICII